MPIIIKDFTWTQSEDRVCIQLPLKGTKASNVDILSSPEFFKVGILYLYDIKKLFIIN